MDDLTNEIVLSLQLDDLNRLLDAATPVQDQRDVTDSQLALVAYRDELALRLDFLRDRRMGRSIARAVLQDDTALREARAQENGAIRDRLTASHLGGVRHIPHPPPLIDLTDGSDDVAINGFSRFNAAPQNPGPIEIGPTTTRPLRHQPHLRSGASLAPPRSRSVSVAQPVRSRESLFGVWKTCVACNEEVSYTCAVYSPCGHDYCKDCAKQIFVNATRDEALFPPRCCRKTIPLAAVDVFLTHEFIEHFRAKSVEFTTPNRTYCSWPTCSTFIPPSSINGETAVCPKCGYWVCTMCKGATHQGRDCPEDGALKNLVATARKAGWQRCNQCHRFVELSLGCNHITCYCGAEFCYLCARRWKTCSCAQWDEQRLLDHANQIADVRHGPAVPEQRAAQVDEIQAVLREHHDCDHHDWRRIGQGGHCHGCNNDFPHFIYACNGCATVACASCRYNRF